MVSFTAFLIVWGILSALTVLAVDDMAGAILISIFIPAILAFLFFVIAVIIVGIGILAILTLLQLIVAVVFQ